MEAKVPAARNSSEESREGLTPTQRGTVVSKSEESFGVGLVFRNMRDGKLVVDSFIKDSSAYQSGVVRDGGLRLLRANYGCLIFAFLAALWRL